MITVRWNDELTLVGAGPPAEGANPNGFENPAVETARTVFADKKSVGRSEFYLGHQAGIEVKLVFDVYTDEYQGETLAEYDGQRFRVLRTHTSKNGEFTELVLSDLCKGGVAGG